MTETPGKVSKRHQKNWAKVWLPPIEACLVWLPWHQWLRLYTCWSCSVWDSLLSVPHQPSTPAGGWRILGLSVSAVSAVSPGPESQMPVCSTGNSIGPVSLEMILGGWDASLRSKHTDLWIHFTATDQKLCCFTQTVMDPSRWTRLSGFILLARTSPALLFDCTKLYGNPASFSFWFVFGRRARTGVRMHADVICLLLLGRFLLLTTVSGPWMSPTFPNMPVSHWSCTQPKSSANGAGLCEELCVATVEAGKFQPWWDTKPLQGLDKWDHLGSRCIC